MYHRRNCCHVTDKYNFNATTIEVFFLLGLYGLCRLLKEEQSFKSHYSRKDMMKNASRDKTQGVYHSGGQVRSCYVTQNRVKTTEGAGEWAAKINIWIGTKNREIKHNYALEIAWNRAFALLHNRMARRTFRQNVEARYFAVATDSPCETGGSTNITNLSST